MLDPLVWILIAATMVLGPEPVDRVQRSPFNAHNVAAVGVGVGILGVVTAGMVAYGVYATLGRTKAVEKAFGPSLKSPPTFPEPPAAPAPKEEPVVTPPPAPEVEPAPAPTPSAQESAPPVPADPTQPGPETAPPAEEPPLSGSGLEPEPTR
ncbi:MAG: hypothetical protein AB2A00_24690 [Myxococcota bacterium]